MHERPLHQIPARDPVTGQELYISELTSMDGEITIRGRFQVPRLSQLDAEQHRFLETFLRCRGMISSVEKELGISYPTVRSRLDALLETLNLAPTAERPRRAAGNLESKRKILEQLEQGEITAEEAKVKLRGEHAR